MKLNKRYAQKLRTHSNLLEGALRLMGEEKGLGDLSLREVAGEAGIVPAAFYRHFKNMEELGLSLVDDCGGRIQAIVGDARNKGAYKSALRLTIGIFFRLRGKQPLPVSLHCSGTDRGQSEDPRKNQGIHESHCYRTGKRHANAKDDSCGRYPICVRTHS